MVSSHRNGLQLRHRLFFRLNDAPSRELGSLFDSVVNTCSTFQPTETTYRLLSRPPRFCPTPTGCCHPAIRFFLRDYLRKLQWRSFLPPRPNVSRFSKKSFAEPPQQCIDPEVRRTCRQLQAAVHSSLNSCTTCFPASNLPDDLLDELSRLRDNEEVTVLPADKGGKWVIVPTHKYIAEAERQLQDPLRYEETSNDIDKATGRRLTVLLKHLRNNGFISTREFRALLPPGDYQPRRFHLLPKVHKESWPDPAMPPGRPIVSDVNSVSRQCASFVELFLAPIAQSAPSYLRDSHHLLAVLEDHALSPETLFFTMDVADLYNNIPIKAGLRVVSEAFLRHVDPKRPDLTLLTMLRLLLTTNAFSFNGKQYLQLQGTPMGGAYSGSFANIFMTDWEKKTRSHPLQPRLWTRFIDDVFGLWDHGEAALREFHLFLNSIDANIQVDLKLDRERIRFLDLELYRHNNSIGYRIGFKPTDCHLILPRDSYHPSHVCKGILFSQILRWATKSSSYEDFDNTKKKVVPVWRQQGHTRSSIRTALRQAFDRTRQSPTAWSTGFFPCRVNCPVCRYGSAISKIEDTTTSNVYRISHRISCQDNNTVYCITCRACKMRYIGQSSRPLRTRIQQHLADVRARRNTPIGEHFDICGLDCFSFAGLERVPDEEQRLGKESAWIRRLHTATPSGLNTMTEERHRQVIVLPNSQCADRTLAICRAMTSSRLTCAKRRSMNLLQCLRS